MDLEPFNLASGGSSSSNDELDRGKHYTLNITATTERNDNLLTACLHTSTNQGSPKKSRLPPHHADRLKQLRLLAMVVSSEISKYVSITGGTLECTLMFERTDPEPDGMFRLLRVHLFPVTDF